MAFQFIGVVRNTFAGCKMDPGLRRDDGGMGCDVGYCDCVGLIALLLSNCCITTALSVLQ